MIDAAGRFRCDVCGRFLADCWPYHKCHDCQERQIAHGRLMARVNARIATAIRAEARHDEQCESELTSHGYSPCRCAERAEGEGESRG